MQFFYLFECEAIFLSLIVRRFVQKKYIWPSYCN